MNNEHFFILSSSVEAEMHNVQTQSHSEMGGGGGDIYFLPFRLSWFWKLSHDQRNCCGCVPLNRCYDSLEFEKSRLIRVREKANVWGFEV